MAVSFQLAWQGVRVSECGWKANPAAKRFADLFLLCYVFLLRMPSEALPMVVADGMAQEAGQSVLWFDDAKQELVLKLQR